MSARLWPASGEAACAPSPPAPLASASFSLAARLQGGRSIDLRGSQTGRRLVFAPHHQFFLDFGGGQNKQLGCTVHWRCAAFGANTCRLSSFQFPSSSSSPLSERSPLENMAHTYTGRVTREDTRPQRTSPALPPLISCPFRSDVPQSECSRRALAECASVIECELHDCPSSSMRQGNSCAGNGHSIVQC